MVIAISTSLGAQNGLLVKDRLALERSRDLDVVIFDKTGTLTRGAPTLSAVAAVSGASEEEVLKLAASVEADSEHPVAKPSSVGRIAAALIPCRAGILRRCRGAAHARL